MDSEPGTTTTNGSNNKLQQYILIEVVTVSAFRQFWQNLIQRFRPHVPWSADEVEREFSVARQERQQLIGQLGELQSEVEHGVSAGRQEQQQLLGQLKSLQLTVEQELVAAGLEKQALHGELTGLRFNYVKL